MTPLWPTDVHPDARLPPPVPAVAGTSSSSRRGRADAAIAGSLMLASVGLHIGAMFPPYAGYPPTAVVSLPYETSIYICLEVGWALAAVLVLAHISVRGGVALGAGLGAVELGLLATDVAAGFQVSNGSAPGVWLAVAGLVAGLAGVLWGASSLSMGAARQHQGDGASVLPGALALLTVLAAGLAAAAFWLPWERCHVVNAICPTASSMLGNAFSEPSGLLAGALVAGLAIGFVAILGALLAAYRPPSDVGAWLTGGVVIALASQLISGYLQVHDEPGAHLSLTAYWTADVLATIALAVLALWAGVVGQSAVMATGPEPPVAGDRVPDEPDEPDDPHDPYDPYEPYEPYERDGIGRVVDRPRPGLSAGAPSSGLVSDDWPAAHHWPER
jgi:hypothetical protein